MQRQEGTIRRRIAISSIALCAVTLGIGSGWQVALAADASPKKQHVNQLYVQSADHGTLTPTKRRGHFTLVLHRVDRETQSIYCCIATDRGQVIQSDLIPTRGFVRYWSGFGFNRRHPTVVLDLLHGRRHANVVALRLNHPRVKSDGQRLAYQARLVHEVGRNLDGFSSALDRHVPRSFGPASLNFEVGIAEVIGNNFVALPFESGARANLSGARLSYATLQHADLRAADLSDAMLSHARLREANLKRADLSGADLDKANLEDAKLRGAILCHTTMPDGHRNNSDCS